jgi:hypothetical protein
MQIYHVVLCQRPSHHWHWLHADVILIEKPKSNTKEKEKRWKYNWIWSSILQESPARLSIYHRWALLKNPKTCDALIKALVFGVETYNWSMCLQHYQGILIITSLLITQTSLRLGTGIDVRDPSNMFLIWEQDASGLQTPRNIQPICTDHMSQQGMMALAAFQVASSWSTLEYILYSIWT